MSHKRKCIICGSEYEYCPNCVQYRFMPTWYTLYCNENCRNIHRIICESQADLISKKEASSKFDMCDMNQFDNFPEATKNCIEKIIGSKKTTRKKKVADESAIDE